MLNQIGLLKWPHIYIIPVHSPNCHSFLMEGVTSCFIEWNSKGRQADASQAINTLRPVFLDMQF